MRFSLRNASALRWGVMSMLLGMAVPAFPQAFPVTTPRLPPRGASAGTPPAQPPAQQPDMQPPAMQQPDMQSPAMQQPAMQQPYNPQPGMPAYGQPDPRYGGGMGGPGAGYGQPQVQTDMQTRMQQPQMGAYGGGGAQSPAVVVVPQRAADGSCRAQPSPDRQTIVLVSGAEALARQHLPLGEFRLQRVVHSPDGKWAVAFTKLRGVAQFSALTIDLERCELRRAIDIASQGNDASFEGDVAVLQLNDGPMRVGLRDGSVK